MPRPPDLRTPDDEPGPELPWLDRREIGKLLRLIGPLLQIPLIWLFLQNPEIARTRTIWIYAGMCLGFVMVLTGILLSGRSVRRP